MGALALNKVSTTEAEHPASFNLHLSTSRQLSGVCLGSHAVPALAIVDLVFLGVELEVLLPGTAVTGIMACEATLVSLLSLTPIVCVFY